MEGTGSPEEAEILVYPGEWQRQEIGIECGRRWYLSWVYRDMKEILRFLRRELVAITQLL